MEDGESTPPSAEVSVDQRTTLTDFTSQNYRTLGQVGTVMTSRVTWWRQVWDVKTFYPQNDGEVDDSRQRKLDRIRRRGFYNVDEAIEYIGMGLNYSYITQLPKATHMFHFSNCLPLNRAVPLHLDVALRDQLHDPGRGDDHVLRHSQWFDLLLGLISVWNGISPSLYLLRFLSKIDLWFLFYFYKLPTKYVTEKA